METVVGLRFSPVSTWLALRTKRLVTTLAVH